jgi:molybdopterin/thiamine biosynthesis adenylyltransferase
MADDPSLHSRSASAGYRPDLLFASVALVVGAGALGQNLASNLALAGVGEIDVVDLDVFEGHNATRSPLYPGADEARRWGMDKARVVAHTLLERMTAPSPIARYAVAPIQALGDLPLARADLVFSAVDSDQARAYLAERCRLVRRPLFEGGFRGSLVNVSVFGPDPEDACYRCLHPTTVGAFSCNAYALRLEAERIIPAIQTAAAVLGGLQAEVGIQWLHGDRARRNTRTSANIRAMTMRTVELTTNPRCPGVHWVAPDEPHDLDLGAEASVRDLLAAVREVVGPAWVVLPTTLVMRHFCSGCHRVVEVQLPEWGWLSSGALCVDCGGAFRLAAPGRVPSPVFRLHTDIETEVGELTCAAAGLAPGCLVEVAPERHRDGVGGERCLVRLRGDLATLMTTAHREPSSADS